MQRKIEQKLVNTRQLYQMKITFVDLFLGQEMWDHNSFPEPACTVDKSWIGTHQSGQTKHIYSLS